MTIHRFFMYAATLGAIGLSIASTVFAADKQIHLRGEITSISDVQLTVKASTGTTTTVQLTDKLKVHDVSRTDLSAIAENSYIGIAAAPSGAGKAKALGVMVFPEGARGLNEGHFPWDLQKESTMTNATVVMVKLLKKSAGPEAEVEVRYGDKSQKIAIDRSTVIGQFVPGQRTLIVKGAQVVIFASESEGTLPMASVVMVGKDGFLPPI